MPDSKSHGNKQRILFLRSWLEQHTDDEHVVTTEEVVRLYRDHGYKATRQTVADDFDALAGADVDVIAETAVRNGTRTNAWHYGQRHFETAELKMLVDAVSSARFITAEKSETLIRKIAEMTNEESRPALTARTFAEERLKASGNSIMVTIDRVYTAIRDGKKISFHYWDWTENREKVLRHDGAEYIASPYALIWNDDRYYVPSWSESREKIVPYRVDRMCDVEVLDETAYRDPDFNAAEYARKVVDMFDDDKEAVTVTLQCRNDLMKNVLDRFGEDIVTEVYDEETFLAKVDVVPSSTFFGRVAMFRGDLRILAPEDVKQAYEGMLREILEKQEE